MKSFVQTGISYFTIAFVFLYASYILFGQGLQVMTYLALSLQASIIIGIVGAVICQKGEQG
ncbi:TPA: hypothetical protein U1235_000262 [Streptococcus suis]|uniref:hypothetical protein n=1 Tax=Streptococcus suis TaxID=1307 RepID=UPI000CF6F2A2|nr:hypothetical protein [Streptococcus suis]MCQ9286106.1 hypothetical protein [Streptococcus suis]HEL1986093.1 hypothetical protein [Streptococcus suis]HEM5105693.1 hypothetical protein [Streptococcus suis]HEM5110107.1 hypothetical protein [Streptococcus suis]HEM5200331.1 hypothetical protein [Streptococcus suis]